MSGGGGEGEGGGGAAGGGIEGEGGGGAEGGGIGIGPPGGALGGAAGGAGCIGWRCRRAALKEAMAKLGRWQREDSLKKDERHATGEIRPHGWRR
eukprot:scaffold205655_cov32-Tisochrysis_lutea.AAC.3